MFKSLDSIASVVGMFMYLTISKLKQVLRSRKGLGKVSTTTLLRIHVSRISLVGPKKKKRRKKKKKKKKKRVTAQILKQILLALLLLT